MVSSADRLYCFRESVKFRRSSTNSRTNWNFAGAGLLGWTANWQPIIWKRLLVRHFLASDCWHGTVSVVTLMNRPRRYSSSCKLTRRSFLEVAQNSSRFVFYLVSKNYFFCSGSRCWLERAVQSKYPATIRRLDGAWWEVDDQRRKSSSTANGCLLAMDRQCMGTSRWTFLDKL